MVNSYPVVFEIYYVYIVTIQPALLQNLVYIVTDDPLIYTFPPFPKSNNLLSELTYELLNEQK